MSQNSETQEYNRLTPNDVIALLEVLAQGIG
jgi:hypothetical protein